MSNKIFDTIVELFEFNEVDSEIFDERFKLLKQLIIYYEKIENYEIVELLKKQKQQIIDYINIDNDYDITQFD